MTLSSTLFVRIQSVRFCFGVRVRSCAVSGRNALCPCPISLHLGILALFGVDEISSVVAFVDEISLVLALQVYNPQKGIVLKNSGLCFVRVVAVAENYLNSDVFTSKYVAYSFKYSFEYSFNFEDTRFWFGSCCRGHMQKTRISCQKVMVPGRQKVQT